MDINLLIENALKSICPVYFEEATFKPGQSEYIVFHRIYGDERNFASGKPIHNYHLYRINYYSKNPFRQQRMNQIKASMKGVGFFMQEDNIPIPREANAEYWGAYSEFTYWEVIGNG